MRGLLWAFAFIGVLRSPGLSVAGPSPGSRSPPARNVALDKPSFTATPAELIALAGTAPTGDWAMVVLRDQHEVSYDDQGRATVRARQVYVMQADGDDDEGDSVYAEWHPSYQDRPALRARVISPAGVAVELDPALIREQPANRPPGADGDRRFLVAQLPSVGPGSVVEQETVVRDREPAVAGRIATTTLGSAAPTSSTVIAFSAPVSVKLRHLERNLPPGVRARHDVARGRETWMWEIPALPVRQVHEIDAPGDVVQAPSIGVTTATSWEMVARAYRKWVDQRIADGPFELPAELPRAAAVETVAAIVAWMHQRVHGAGNATTHGVRVPRSPAETVKQASGDCNDQAALLVALLRQVGIRAEVAPVAGRWQPLDPELPGLEVFEHVLVRARVGSGELWIDPDEALARPGQLPERDQGRRALVIADDTRALATTPRSGPADNVIRDVRTFVAAESGLSQLTRVVRYTGLFELEQRDHVHGVRADQLRRVTAASVKSAFGGTLDQATSTDAADLTRPFEITHVVKDSSLVSTELEQIDVYLSTDAVLDQLPWLVKAGSESSRRSDFVWSRPHVHEVENRIVVPPGFTLPAPAAERVRQLGTVTLTERQRIDGQTLIVTYRLDTGKPRLTPAELTTLRAKLHELDGERLHIKLDHAGSALSFAGKPREAIAECERLIALHPTEALHHSQLAMVLMRAGAGAAARREARKAVTMAPSDGGALVVLGWALSFDTLGRRYTYDWDRAGAIAALQQARKLSPGHVGAVLELAELLQRGPSGQLYEGADLAAAAEAWRAALALERTDEQVLALARVLVWSGAWDEAEKVARTAKDSEERNKWIVAAIAGAGGAAAAIQAASALSSGDSRNRLVTAVGWVMMFLRRYDVARALAAETGLL
ncbi:MAG TPA: DUF3857 domain-containing protein, partial [Kofleriaceae bacterium]|nr:DUF3857 domain-containing protein [Kofleriaceae bacterium]